jgi:hypothetical protein
MEFIGCNIIIETVLSCTHFLVFFCKKSILLDCGAGEELS